MTSMTILTEKDLRNIVRLDADAVACFVDAFRALETKSNAPLPSVPEMRKPEDFAAWLKTVRNDLQAPAERIAPPVGEALALLRRAPGVLAAVMSGSGATCVGICKDAGAARTAARAIQVARQSWWVAPAPLLA